MRALVLLLLVAGCAEQHIQAIQPPHVISRYEAARYSDYILCRGLMSANVSVADKNVAAQELQDRKQDCKQYLPMIYAEIQQERQQQAQQQANSDLITATGLELLRQGQPHTLTPAPITCQTYGNQTTCQ